MESSGQADLVALLRHAAADSAMLDSAPADLGQLEAFAKPHSYWCAPLPPPPLPHTPPSHCCSALSGASRAAAERWPAGCRADSLRPLLDAGKEMQRYCDQLEETQEAMEALMARG